MSLPPPSFRAHLIVEYIRSAGFWLESHEVEDLGVKAIVQDLYSIEAPLQADEWAMVESELLNLAQENEKQEALVKLAEIKPEDYGVDFCRQPSSSGIDKVSSYPVYFSYPVEESLRMVRKRPAPGLPFLKAARKPATGQAGAGGESSEGGDDVPPGRPESEGQGPGGRPGPIDGGCGGPRQLPTVTLQNGKTYFVDERLRQMRNVEVPWDIIDF